MKYYNVSVSKTILAEIEEISDLLFQSAHQNTSFAIKIN